MRVIVRTRRGELRLLPLGSGFGRLLRLIWLKVTGAQLVRRDRSVHQLVPAVAQPGMAKEHKARGTVRILRPRPLQRLS